MAKLMYLTVFVEIVGDSMKIVNRYTNNTLTICKRENIIKVLGIPTKMKDCGYTVTGDDDNIFKDHIVNCLDVEILCKYINRFLQCKTKEEIKYIKLLANKGLLEDQEIKVDGKDARILHWNESSKYMPMYVMKTSKGSWSKQKRILYGNYKVTGYKDFNHRI